MVGGGVIFGGLIYLGLNLMKNQKVEIDGLLKLG
jgi:hypothetical protein